MDDKVWWKSRVLWVSVIAALCTAVQAKYGFVVSPEYQGYALAAVMFILRLLTTNSITLKQEGER